MSSVDLSMLLAAREMPLRPAMLPPGPQLVAITDTNALAARACNAAEAGTAEDLYRGLSRTGRSNTFVGSHVPGELIEHLADVAGTRVDLGSAERVLWTEIMQRVAVVDLAVRDYMHPRIRTILNADPSLPSVMRGDPDDIGTAALAEFLAPAVILSADSVFTRHGMSNTTARTWVTTAYNLMRAAGLEASWAAAAWLAELAARVAFATIGRTYRLARTYPVPFLLVLGAALFAAVRLGFLRRERLSDGLRRLRKAAEPMMLMYAGQAAFHAAARGGLRVVEPYGPATDQQQIARHLARRGRAATPLQLRDELQTWERRFSGAAIKRTMTGHPAFVREPGDLYSVAKRIDASRIIRLGP